MRLGTKRTLALLMTLFGAVLVAPPPAGATTTTIGVSDFAFSRTSVVVAQGSTVTWQFHAEHTTTSNQGFWNSGHRMSGNYVVAFPDAGSFGYHCTMHPSMTGVVKVPLKAAGKASTGYQVTWSSAATTPSNIRFDVQYRRIGATKWTAFRTRSAARAARFNPSRNGTYRLRARTARAGRASGWSPLLGLRIS